MIDAKKALKKLRGEANRKKKDLYLNVEILGRFRAVCKKQRVSANKMLEELMSQYIEQAKRLK